MTPDNARGSNNNYEESSDMLDASRTLDSGNEKFKPPPDLTPPLHLFPPTVRPLHPAPTNRKTQDNSYKGYVKLCLCGVTLMGIAFGVHFIEPVQVAKKITLTMRPDSYIFDLWKAPPIKLYIKVFVFNITNAHEFMAGIDHKLKVEEVGPYTYSEKLENTNVSFFDNDTLSFNPVRKIIFEKELSVGDPYRDIVTVTNIPLLGLASMMHNSSIGMSLMLSTLISYMDAQPLLTLPVDSFLWGYDDPLVKLARRTVPAWINFERFGLLDRMIDEGNYRVNMYLKKTEDSDQFMVSTINGSPGLKNWGYDSSSNRTSKCNSARGTTEGYLMPANLQPNSSFTIFRRAFCRPLPFVYVGQEITRQGYRAFRYSFPDNILDPDNPDNKCYCKKDGCLKRGLSDLSPCYYNIPVAISLPHFYKADKSLVEGVEGLNPNEEKHASVYAVQPDSGVPLYVKTRVQTNLVLKHSKYIPRVRKFNDLVIPVFWMEVELMGLPKSVTMLMDLLLIIGPALQHYSIALSAIAGLAIVFFANLRYAWRSGLFDSRRRATLIRFRQKQRHSSQRGDIKPKDNALYVQLMPIPNTQQYISR
ncbi:CD36 family [Nesidiocoris tenuis]|uniref:CD36 family n=1 Tax=Nesidiocoris tenuis TaxID=355587 RepID=A0ABN7AUL8_9HEMI|nr:CD36 family [Nesidiocoris tenuis]